MQSGKRQRQSRRWPLRTATPPAIATPPRATPTAEQIASKLAGSAGAESVKTAVFAHHPPEVVRFFLLSTHYRSPIDFSLENIAATAKSMEGFYRLFETVRADHRDELLFA